MVNIDAGVNMKILVVVKTKGTPGFRGVCVDREPMLVFATRFPCICKGFLMLPASEYALILSNTETIPGRQIVEFYGVVTGNTVRAKHVGRDIMAGLKNIVGGELKGYTELLQDSRREATERMVEQAQSMGANAVVNVRYATSSISQGAAELFAYGTAVRISQV
jgi:uncharacterized protein YbjQ (UPF0145 family)